MDIKNHKTWVRIAGHANNIKTNHPHAWRCYIEGNSTEIPLRDWFVIGKAERINFIPGYNTHGDKNGLVAWIDCFGICTIENEVLEIVFKIPHTPPPAHKAQQ